jgi:hypothetical protein
MSKVPPYHSTSEEDREVYHIYDDCPEGSQILLKNWEAGKAGRERCDSCTRKKDTGKF